MQRTATIVTRRRLATIAVLLGGALLLGGLAPAPAAATTRSEKRMTAYVNYARNYYNQPSLRLSEGLSDVARAHSRRMASSGRIYHHSNLGYTLRKWTWTVAGENVGRGYSMKSIYRAFMRSSTHRAEILYKPYRRIGVGVVWKGSVAYVTVLFLNR